MAVRNVREAVVTYRMSERAVPARVIQSSRDAVEVLRQVVPDGPQERLVVLGLDAKNRTVGWTLVGAGGISSCPVEPASVFRWAVLESVAAVILCHNHPSGDPTPSADDVALTERVRKAGDILGIRVLDHIVLGDGESYRSLLDAGLHDRR